MDNTGKLVAYTTASGTKVCVSTDAGQATGYRDGVRALTGTVQYPNISARWSATWSAICAAGGGYGMGCGDTSRLYPVTAEQVAALAAEDADNAAKAAAKQTADDAAEKSFAQTARKVCRHCGSHCYGDCRA